jgi:hypothetical protein
MEKQRCINIDWLEVYCKEDFDRFPVDADYYRNHGYMVSERDYGTRQYEQMFTILDKDDRPFIEVRRKPVSGNQGAKNKGIFDPQSCHLRLANRWCYADNAVSIFSEFLMQHDYIVVRLYRLDLCMDFEKFDQGDNPIDVVKRYLKGSYVKINQANVTAHGHDAWQIRDWNSLSWGAPKSMVTTKLYNKTKELSEAKDKPYIRYAWFVAGLVDDYQSLVKVRPDGTSYQPTIWRVEFSIRSVAKGWCLVEDNNGAKYKTIRMEHSLATYATKADQLKAFMNLSHHYFHFKIYEEGVRKDKLEDKVLFEFANNEVYHLDRLLTDKPKDTTAEALAKRLRAYRIQSPDANVRAACDVLLNSLKELRIKHSLPNFYDQTEAKLLQFLIERRLNNPDETFTDSVHLVEALLATEGEVF